MKWPRYSLFLVLCLVLILYQKINPSNSYPFGYYEKTIQDEIYNWLLYKFPNWNSQSLKVLISYLVGSSLKGMHELKYSHEVLNLSHLLSPSAFHLASLNWILYRLFSKKWIILFYCLLIVLSYFILPLHPALIRSLLISGITLTFANHQKIELFVFCALILDFFFGTYQLMPMSYIFTFIILGNIYLLPSEMSLFKKILISQCILAFFFHQKFSLVSFFCGFYLGLIFVPILTGIIFYVFLFPVVSISISGGLETLFNFYLLLMQKTAQTLNDNNLNQLVNSNIIFLIFILIKWYRAQISIPLIILFVLWSDSILG
jgi:hypothetical protein